ncbi:MAG: isochorismatase family protein [Proteobacteria bacterium]|nr:isochorismatase family protein [Pseudomonadota bacterium]
MTAEQHDRQGLIAREDCVLVIIDVQEKLVPAISDKENVVENVLRLVRFANIMRLPIVVTEQEKLGNTIPEANKELEYAHRIKKVHFNCFFCGDFSDWINKLGKSTLILAGLEAHICVAQTAIFALPRFNVHIMSDAVSSRARGNHIVSMERMRQCGAVISSTEMFIYELLQKAGTNEFRSVLPLVK